MKRVTLLGATGSIGTQTLDVVRGLNQCGDFPVKVEVLSARANIHLLEQQIREFKPKIAVVENMLAAKALRQSISDLDVQVLEGIDGLCEAAAFEKSDIVLNAVVGMVGLRPTLSAIRAKKTIALANKETLVAGGCIVMQEARHHNVKILPVDSEHSAIFQCLQGTHEKKQVERLILTASGGPFFGMNRDELAKVTVEQALKHPNWDMGAKITVDSASMMNKGLEFIEACWLFDMPPESVEVVVHRESIVHSLISYVDQSVIAQMGVPDMRVPIQYSLTYPERFASQAKRLDLWDYQNLSFFRPDYENFRNLSICMEAMKRGGLAPAAANAANEEAVELFLSEKINFLEISELVEGAVDRQPHKSLTSLDDVLDADQAAREFVRSKI